MRIKFLAVGTESYRSDVIVHFEAENFSERFRRQKMDVAEPSVKCNLEILNGCYSTAAVERIGNFKLVVSNSQGRNLGCSVASTRTSSISSTQGIGLGREGILQPVLLIQMITQV